MASVTRAVLVRIVIGTALLAMIGFVVYFSVTQFAQTSLRLDEAQSLFQTNRDIPGVLKLVGQDVHVPLYHVLLHYWQVIFGNDIFTARLLSLVFFALTIPMVYLLAKYVYGRKVALFAALLVSLSPFLNWYGSEARMYSMLTFVTVFHLYMFLKLYREAKTSSWVWFTISAIVGIYTHYFFAFVLLGEALFYFMYRRDFAVRKSFRKFLLSAGVVVASIIPWLLYVRMLGSASNTQPNLNEPTSIDLFNTYSQFIFGFQPDALNTVIVSLWPIVVLLAFFGLQRHKKISHETIFFIIMATVPVIAAFVASIALRPFYQSRYLIVALPPLLIFVSWLVSIYPKRIALLFRGVLVVAILGLFAFQVTNPQTPVKENYEEAVKYLEQRASGRDVIVLSAPFTIYPVEYYYQGSAKLTTQPIWDRFESGGAPGFDKNKLEAETKQNTDSYQTAWVVLSFDQGYNDEIKRYYDSHFQRVEAKEFSKNLWVYAYKLRYDAPVKLGSE